MRNNRTKQSNRSQIQPTHSINLRRQLQTPASIPFNAHPMEARNSKKIVEREVMGIDYVPTSQLDR